MASVSGSGERPTTDREQRLLVVCPVCRTPTEVIVFRASAIETDIQHIIEKQVGEGSEIKCTLAELGFVCPECEFACSFTDEQCRRLELRHQLRFGPS